MFACNENKSNLILSYWYHPFSYHLEYGSCFCWWYIPHWVECLYPRSTRGKTEAVTFATANSVLSNLWFGILPHWNFINFKCYPFLLLKLHISSFLSLFQTHFDGRLFELRITCGPDYPNKAPKVRFTSRINLSSVNQSTGAIENDLPALAQWNRNMTMWVYSSIKIFVVKLSWLHSNYIKLIQHLIWSVPEMKILRFLFI